MLIDQDNGQSFHMRFGWDNTSYHSWVIVSVYLHLVNSYLRVTRPFKGI